MERYDYRDGGRNKIGFTVDPKCTICKVKYGRRCLKRLLDGGAMAGGDVGINEWEDAVSTTLEAVRYIKRLRRWARWEERRRRQGQSVEEVKLAPLVPSASTFTPGMLDILLTGCGNHNSGGSSDECFSSYGDSDGSDSDSDSSYNRKKSDNSASAPLQSRKESSHHLPRGSLQLAPGELRAYLLEKDPRLRQEVDDLTALRAKLRTSVGRAELGLSEEDARAAEAGFGGIGNDAELAASDRSIKEEAQPSDGQKQKIEEEDAVLACSLAAELEQTEAEDARRKRRRMEADDERIAREMQKEFERGMALALKPLGSRRRARRPPQRLLDVLQKKDNSNPSSPSSASSLRKRKKMKKKGEAVSGSKVRARRLDSTLIAKPMVKASGVPTASEASSGVDYILPQVSSPSNCDGEAADVDIEGITTDAGDTVTPLKRLWWGNYDNTNEHEHDVEEGAQATSLPAATSSDRVPSTCLSPAGQGTKEERESHPHSLQTAAKGPFAEMPALALATNMTGTKPAGNTMTAAAAMRTSISSSSSSSSVGPTPSRHHVSRGMTMVSSSFYWGDYRKRTLHKDAGSTTGGNAQDDGTDDDDGTETKTSTKNDAYVDEDVAVVRNVKTLGTGGQDFSLTGIGGPSVRGGRQRRQKREKKLKVLPGLSETSLKPEENGATPAVTQPLEDDSAVSGVLVKSTHLTAGSMLPSRYQLPISSLSSFKSAGGNGGGGSHKKVEVDPIVFQNLVAMGFPCRKVKQSLMDANGDADLAASMLVSEAVQDMKYG